MPFANVEQLRRAVENALCEGLAAQSGDWIAKGPEGEVQLRRRTGGPPRQGPLPARVIATRTPPATGGVAPTQETTVTKQEIWDAEIADGWEPNDGDHDLFFSDRLDIDAKNPREIAFASIPAIVDELRTRPKLEISLYRHGACFSSPDVADCNDQDHWPTWNNWAVEDCSRDFDGTKHSVSWCFG